VIGCGVIGERRAMQLPVGVHISACYDINPERARHLAGKFTNAKAVNTLEEFLATPGLEAVLIAAINSELVPLAQACLNKGLHILVEKPAARSIRELETLKNPHGRIIKVGFNHRFHPAFERLHEELAKDPADPIMFIRAQYGNGARLGFEKEWRAKVELGGGGELLDQGVHVLDLAAVLIPDLDVVAGYTRTHFWNMPVDDNTWGILRSPESGATFTFHVSSTEWKNEFRFEVYTRTCKFQWLGLGRSYGPERLLIHRMTPEMGPPVSEEIMFSKDDQSWLLENENFLGSIRRHLHVNGGLEDAVRALSLVEDIYQSSRRLQHGTTDHPRWWQDQETGPGASLFDRTEEELV
jgi:predicted dehydrogenase